MQIAKCPNCALPFESSNYYLKGMNIKCRNCGYSGLPLNSGACFYDKIRVETKPHDPFKGFLSAESLLSKLAMLSFSSALISAWSIDLRYFTIVSFFGFVMFGALYAFFRIRSS